ncbi:acyl-CoA dehydrogenase family protein [Nocardia terpenica]|uniref:acyl-CoA dehydrogenase family protein n=1 Tax=Nocardia terpenica TaxID=455432 RepID=UPI001894E968|nr:acyl-CoA dehydrogenase family protein [Nocardia terpenica]MBF6061099.1 acyl-CoA dehydrogenase family protein [Nocardia terpenica]MBF6105672.1 acyl-CoA dehydrogenase family protein [Nocardia terpenica]MBF6112858.1 acyl-CoA dehydrogenase family protein [Nocardia terpenica]MBF6118988.1 acyl-CoA dehydrogenase family protein [Nocardia terpenica]
MSDTSAEARLHKPPPTAEQKVWLARLAQIAPVIEEHSDRAERERRMPARVFEALRDSGVPRMWVSKDFGGEQVSIETGVVVLEALARLDASVAWQMGVQGAIGRLSDYLPEDSARELFKNNTQLVVGGVKPFGQAEPVDGGYIIQGEWSFASGIAHAGWLACMAFLTADGDPVIDADGPDIRVPFIPISKAEQLDTWYTIGLRGTGSNNYRVAPTFVPAELTITKAQMQHAPAERLSRAYAISYYDFGPFTVAPIAVGIAQDALSTFKAMAGKKVPASGKTVLAASHTAQEKLGRAEMLVYSAHLLLMEAARQATLFGEKGSDSLAALIRLTGATVAEKTIEAVNIVYELAGSSSIYTTSRLDRCFRDIHSATKHIALSSSHFEMAGQYLLGGELQMRR